MTTSWRVWGVAALLVLVHFLLHLGLGLGEAAPDLLTVALLLGAREVGMGTAAFLGLLLGLLEDAFSVLSFGANAVAMTIVGAAAALTRTFFVGDSLFFLVSYLFVGKWARDLLFWTFAGESAREPFVDSVVVQGTIQAGYAALVGVAVMVFTGAWWQSIR